MKQYRIALTLLFLSFLLTACKTKTAEVQKDSGVAAGRFPDQREHLKAFKDDIVIMECVDYDFNTAPIGIGDKFFTLLHGWVYTDGVLSHTITGQGLTEGILVQDFPNNEDLKASGGYYVSDKPYIKMNLYRTKDAVWFMNKRYPIARENADSIFSPLMKSANEKTGSVWIFVGDIPLKSK
ncbi:hypothetical protein [Prevotella melaninogenica]|uniref:hypothetical protein n=1 Tax=Prevotella melaninogenica TaxID=28132 RepID=UPI003C761046